MNLPNTARATGRRKSSIANALLMSGTGKLIINNKSGMDYLQQNNHLIVKLQSPLCFLQLKDKIDLMIAVKGGGLAGQADAMQLAICRALCQWKSDYRPVLKYKGYLVCDARVKERKKYGLKKARKAGQFSKR